MDLTHKLQALALPDQPASQFRVLVPTPQSSLIEAKLKQQLTGWRKNAENVPITAIIATELEASFIVTGKCRLAPDPNSDRWAVRNISEDGPLAIIEVFDLCEVNRTVINPRCDCWLQSPGTYHFADDERKQHIISLRLLPRPGLRLHVDQRRELLTTVTNEHHKRQQLDNPEESRSSKRLQSGQRENRVAISVATVVDMAPYIMDLTHFNENDTIVLSHPKEYSLTKQQDIFAVKRGGRNPAFIGTHSNYNQTVLVKALSNIFEKPTELLNAVDEWTHEMYMNSNIKQHDHLAEFLEGDARILCIVFTYVKSGNLSKLRTPGTDFFNGTAEDGLRIMRDIVPVMVCLHYDNVVHNDIKPENILITLDGEKALMCDLGMATPHDKSSKGGTHGYLPPEVWIAPDSRGFASDVWALGLISLFLAKVMPLPEKFIQRYEFTLAWKGNIDAIRIRDEGYAKIRAARVAAAEKATESTGAKRVLLDIATQALDPVPQRRPSMKTINQQLRKPSRPCPGECSAVPSDKAKRPFASTEFIKVPPEVVEALPLAISDNSHDALDRVSGVSHSSQEGSTQAGGSQAYRDAANLMREKFEHNSDPRILKISRPTHDTQAGSTQVANLQSEHDATDSVSAETLTSSRFCP